MQSRTATMSALIFASFMFSALAAGVTGPTAYNNGSTLTTYPKPAGMPDSINYTVTVQAPGGSPKQLDIYQAQLGQVNLTSGSGISYNTSFAFFDFSDTAKVSVQYSPGIKTVDIRPHSYGITPTVDHDMITFTLDRPRDVVIQVNDDIFGTLQLFSNYIEDDIPAPNSTDILYFGPGINNGTANISTNGTLDVPSGKIVYIAGGGVLEAQVRFANVSNAGLRGRGVLSQNPGGAFRVDYSSDITISDVIVANPQGYAARIGNSQGVHISGLRAFSSAGWGDGIDSFCSQDVLLEKLFMRNSDDNIALYQHRWDYYGDSRNLTVRDSTLWADYAHPIMMGTHGNTANPETMDGVTIQNIDILDQHEPQMWYQGCLAINEGDSNTIQNVWAEDIRVENFRWGQLVNIRTMFNEKYNTSPGKKIQNVTIKDLTYHGDRANPSLLLGYDEERPVTNITFVNLEVNGKLIYDDMQKPSWYYTADEVPMFANSHVKDLVFLKE